MLKPRVVTFDGDKYIMTLPGINGIKYLMENHSFRMEGYPDFYICCSSRFAVDDQRIRTRFYVAKGLPLLHGSNEAFASYEEEYGMVVERDTDYGNFSSDKWCGYVPMLVPLDRDEVDISAQFRKDNPDGTLLLGGTISCEGNPVTPEEHARCESGSQLNMTDSIDGKRLCWICYCGHLYAVSPCCEIQFSTLETCAPVYTNIGEDGLRYQISDLKSK